MLSGWMSANQASDEFFLNNNIQMTQIMQIYGSGRAVRTKIESSHDRAPINFE
jgi:hypothetical protein